jgi:MAC/Perforin domain
MPTSSASNDSSRQIPGLSMLGYGYDVFQSAYCSDEACTELLLTGLDPGSSSREVQLSPEWKGSFQCPSIVRVLSEQVQNDDYSLFAETVEEYTSKLSVKASVSGSYGAFSGSVEASYSESTSSYLDNQYGEYGHIFSGVKLALPHSASELRALIQASVKQKLLSMAPDQLIQLYGTHLVTGLVIGAKARLLQYASRSKVTTTEEFSTAVKAQYGSVTASASVDQSQSNTIAKFEMASEVHTLGGGNVVIRTKDDFDKWLDSVYDDPAVIDTTSFVPLYQLLDPATEAAPRQALKDAILAYAKRFQVGAVYGTSQDYSNMGASNPWVQENSFGNQLGRQNNGASALSYSASYGEGNSLLIFWLATGQEAAQQEPPQGMAVYGGRQDQSNDRSSAPFQQMSMWGTNTHPLTKAPLTEWRPAFKAFAPEGPYGDMGMSFITMYVGPIEQAPAGGYVIVGGKTVWGDGTQPATWGSPSTGLIKEQPIGRLKSYHSGGAGFAACTVCIHLSPVLDRLAEVPEG